MGIIKAKINRKWKGEISISIYKSIFKLQKLGESKGILILLKRGQQAQNGVSYAKPHVHKPQLSFGSPKMES